MNEWFTEDLEIVSGWRQQIAVTDHLHSERTDYQQVDVYQTVRHGRMLVLDRVVNLTEFDEHAYHEMIVHVPLMAHRNPRRVLVIGGGDGGAVREVARHACVEHIDLCEIDARVVELAREFFASTASGFADPRVQIHHVDGVQWVREHPGGYDVIIVDSTDPIGAARALFEFPFFEAAAAALRPEGIVVTQAENFFLHQDIIRELLEFGRRVVADPRYFYTLVPTYPGGMIGFTFMRRAANAAISEALDERVGASADLISNLRYWTPRLHEAAFVLPAQVQSNLFGE